MSAFIEIDADADLGLLGTVPLRLTFDAHEGRLEVSEIAVRLAAGVRSLPQLDLLADALGIHLDAVLLAGATAPQDHLAEIDGE